MSTARERAKLASDEALRKKTASPTPGRPSPGRLSSSASVRSSTSNNAPRSSTLARPGSTSLTKPPTRPSNNGPPARVKTAEPEDVGMSSDTSSRPSSSAGAKPARPNSVAGAGRMKAEAPLSPAVTASSSNAERPATLDTARFVKEPSTTQGNPVSKIGSNDSIRTPRSPAKLLRSPIRSPAKLVEPTSTSPVSIVSNTPSRQMQPMKLSPVKELGSKSAHTPLRPRAPSQAASEALARSPKAATHTRARSVVESGRSPTRSVRNDSAGDDHQLREFKIMNDLLKETKRREDLEEEIKQLKEIVSKARATKATDASDSQVPPRSPVKLRQSAASERHDREMADLRKDYETRLTALQRELDLSKAKSPRLGGVESRIADVETALRDSQQQLHQEKDGHKAALDKGNQDKLELAKTIQDLKEEIDRAQSQLDEENVRAKQEKEEALQVTQDLRRELEAVKKQHSSELESREASSKDATVQLATLQDRFAEADRLKFEAIDDLEQARSHATSIDQSLDDLRKQLADANTLIAKYTAREYTDKASADEETSNLKQQIEDLSRAIAEAAEKAQEVEEEHKTSLEAADRALSDARAKHTTSLAEVTDKHSQAEAASASLREELKTLEDKTTTDFKELLYERDELAERNRKLQIDLDNSIAAAAELEQTKQERAAAEEQHQKALEEVSTHRDEHARQVEKLRQELDVVTTQAEKATKLQTDLEQMTHQHQMVAKERDAQVQDSSELRTRVTEMESQVADFARLKTDFDALNSSHEAVSAERDNLTAELEKTRTDLQDGTIAVERCAELQKALDNATEDHEKAVSVHKTELESLRAELSSSQAANTEIAKVMEQLFQAQQEAKSASERVNELEDDIKQNDQARSEEIAQQEALLNDARSTLTTMEAGKRVLEAKIARLEEKEQDSLHAGKRLEELQAVSNSKNAELARVRSEHDLLLSQLRTEQAETFAALDKQLADATGEHSNALSRLKEDHESEIQKQLSIKVQEHDTAFAEAVSHHEEMLAEVKNSLESELETIRSENDSLKSQVELLVAARAQDGPQDGEDGEPAPVSDRLEQDSTAHAVSVPSSEISKDLDGEQSMPPKESEVLDSEATAKHEKAMAQLKIDMERALSEERAQHVSQLSTQEAAFNAQLAEMQHRLTAAQSQANASAEEALPRPVTEPQPAVDDRSLRPVTSPIPPQHTDTSQKIITALSRRIADLEIQLSDAHAERASHLRHSSSTSISHPTSPAPGRPGLAGTLSRHGSSPGTSTPRSAPRRPAGSARHASASGARSLASPFPSGQVEDPFVSTTADHERGIMPEQERELNRDVSEWDVEQLGHSVESTLASIQEQVKALEQLNDQLGDTAGAARRRRRQNSRRASGLVAVVYGGSPSVPASPAAVAM